MKNVLQSIAGVEVYAVFSLLLFVAMFTFMVILVMRASKKYIDRMAKMPLEGDDEHTTVQSTTKH
jgi:preprotein translocase subunit YajC